MDVRARTIKTIALAMLLMVSGCTSWFDSGDKDPDVHLEKVELVQAKLLEQRFRLHFRVDNPNDSTLTVRGLSYAVYLGTIKLTEGENEHWFSVQPKSSADYVIPVRTNLWPQIRDVVQMLKNPDKPVPYRLEGELKTGLFIGYDVQVNHNGEIIPGDFIPE